MWETSLSKEAEYRDEGVCCTVLAESAHVMRLVYINNLIFSQSDFHLRDGVHDNYRG